MAHLIDLSSTGHGSQGEVVIANIALDGGGPLTYQRGMAVVDDRSGYGPTTLFLLGHSGTQAQLRALSVAAFHADNNTPDWHTLETVTATPAILKGRLQPSPDGQRLAYARTTGSGMGLLQWGGNELRVVSLDPGRLALSGAPLTVTGPTGRISGLDFSPAADYLYFTVSGLSYPTTQRLYRLPLAGGAIAPMAWHVTDVRRNAQQGGTDMLCTTTTGLRRIAQPDDASPTQTTHALPGIQPALALQPVLIGPDRSTSTRHLGRRRYELTDHLGNVRAVVGDRKLSDFSLDINTPILVPTSFSAEVLSYADYDPFGSLLDERHALAYRFGFQGQEKDDEIHGATGTSYAFEYRMHDPRVGRFLSIDPLAAKYPFYSPYAFSGNRVIDMIELEGLEPEITADKLRAMGDQNAAWGFGARGNENTGWQQDINGQTYQTYQCSDCYSNNDRGDRQGLANPLMWAKAPALAQDPLPTIPDDANSGPVGGNTMDQPALQVPKADAGQPAPPPISRPTAPERNKFLPVNVPIYTTGDMIARDDPMGADVYGPIDKMINAINANAGQYRVLSLSVQIGQGLNYNTERGFSENGFNQLHGYIRSRLDSSIQIQRGSVGPATDDQRAVPGSSVAIYLH